MECNKGFSSNYMLLNPEELTFFDLIKFLFYTNIEKRKFVDSTEVEEESLERRWLMFVSIIVQKLLQFFSRPLSFVGSMLEMWLNLLSINRGCCRLLLNIFRGKVAIPDKTSAAFVSVTGNYDLRTELDRNIKHGDARYHAALSIMASKASYENHAYLESIVQDHWEMELLGSYDFWNDYQDQATTQAFLLRDKTDDHDTIVVAFRGTEPFDAYAWCSDFDLSWYELPGVGRIHGGFMKALGLQKSHGWPKEIKKDNSRPAPLAYYAIREMLKDILSENDQGKYIVTGHSLGGALAILFPAVLAFHDEELLLDRLQEVYTFGQPRVGDENFVKYMENMLKLNKISYYRFVYGSDIVPRLPYDDKALMFKHFGTCLYFNRDYEGKVVPEEPYKNYLSLRGAIPMIINAFLELIRSFTISYTKGRDYREGWFLTGVRLTGLAFPGVPPHLIQDYVNSTRLGPENLSGCVSYFMERRHRKKSICELPGRKRGESPSSMAYISLSAITKNSAIHSQANGIIWIKIRDVAKPCIMVERPVKESETFLSFVGHLDKRVDLDKNIKHGDSRYYSALSVMAAKVAYENKAFVENAVRNHWKMELIGYYDFWNDFQKKRTTQGFMLHDKNADMIIVAFRGTEAFDADAWSTDFDISWYEFPGKGKIHCGFMKALGLLMDQGWPEKYKQEDEQRPIAYYTIREKLRELLEQNETTKFILTGHSMGGAIATLFPAVLAMHHETGLLKRLEGVYTFGQPRVGDEEFKRFMESLMQNHGFKYLRFVYCNDVVTRLPIDDSTFLFKHFGTCVYHNSCYNGKIVSEEPHKNYISVFAAIPRFLNALWELARSFILPCRKGLDYKESWLLILVRWYGLILPGLSAHTPQDYVNITRLGPETIFRHLQDPESGSVSDSDETKD
uniref:Fungal lipase-type domain-containing protein n=1 Tax=Salix viminalis TaxID=40686 RepID=A0A6N2N7D8_SALVM